MEGTKFDIPLYFKWNLISVPFVLLDDGPEEVFKDIKDEIKSVWSYENGEWSVWTPGEDPDTLEHIEPGLGYFVLSKSGSAEEPLWLKIGGNLLNPVEVPPGRNLTGGWNLIGYYGTSWELYDIGDFNFVCGDAFNFPDRYVYGDNVYCSLSSLVDTKEGYPRWSSLWGYLNCGDHTAFWVGLNTCAEDGLQDMLSRMYAGRGYWIEMEEGDIYAPATTCIWKEMWSCRQTGGGVLP